MDITELLPLEALVLVGEANQESPLVISALQNQGTVRDKVMRIVFSIGVGLQGGKGAPLQEGTFQLRPACRGGESCVGLWGPAYARQSREQV